MRFRDSRPEFTGLGGERGGRFGAGEKLGVAENFIPASPLCERSEEPCMIFIAHHSDDQDGGFIAEVGVH